MAPAPKVRLTRRVVFSASHRLHSPALSDAENLLIFEKCSGENGHGHNYTLEVTLFGEIDRKTGMVFSLAELRDAIAETVEKDLDHKYLNLDVPEFRELNPTVENVAVVIWRRLEKVLPKGLLFEIKLHETENNAAVYRGE